MGVCAGGCGSVVLLKLEINRTQENPKDTLIHHTHPPTQYTTQHTHNTHTHTHIQLFKKPLFSGKVTHMVSVGMTKTHTLLIYKP